MIYIFKNLLLSRKETDIVGQATNDGIDQWFQKDDEMSLIQDIF